MVSFNENSDEGVSEPAATGPTARQMLGGSATVGEGCTVLPLGSITGMMACRENLARVCVRTSESASQAQKADAKHTDDE